MRKTTFNNLKSGQKLRIPLPQTEIEEWEPIIYHSEWMYVIITKNDEYSETRGGVLHIDSGLVYDLSNPKGSEPTNVWTKFLTKHSNGFEVQIIEPNE
jgi:hypothetical protein